MQATTKNNFVSLKGLIIAATILSGFLAGTTVDRFVVEFPAFKQLDISFWANYSRHADLGNGLFLYPAEGIGTFILLLASSIVILYNRGLYKNEAGPVHTAMLLSFAGIFFTAFAAPAMLSLKTIDNNTVLLQHAFDTFYFWSAWRAIAQVLCFFACVWALGKISRAVI